MDKSKVSILMPVFNEEKYIFEAIKSVLDQHHNSIELIIVDDGSTDNTVKEIDKFSHDSRVKLLSPGKIGKAAAFNLAFSFSNGAWISLFAGDDLLPNDSISSRIAQLMGRDGLSEKIAMFSKLESFSKIKKYDGLVIPRHKNRGNLSGGTTLMSRRLAEDIFPIPEELPNEDTWTMLGIEYLSDEIVHFPQVTIYYRIHPKNTSAKDMTFDEKSDFLHKRFSAYGIFLNNFVDRLTIRQKTSLSSLANAEEARYKQKPAKILFLPEISLKTRLTMIVHSIPTLYCIRTHFFSLFSGW